MKVPKRFRQMISGTNYYVNWKYVHPPQGGGERECYLEEKSENRDDGRGGGGLKCVRKERGKINRKLK
jgi:hypothetical protein